MDLREIGDAAAIGWIRRQAGRLWRRRVTVRVTTERRGLTGTYRTEDWWEFPPGRRNGRNAVGNWGEALAQIPGLDEHARALASIVAGTELTRRAPRGVSLAIWAACGGIDRQAVDPVPGGYVRLDVTPDAPNVLLVEASTSRTFDGAVWRLRLARGTRLESAEFVGPRSPQRVHAVPWRPWVLAGRDGARVAVAGLALAGALALLGLPGGYRAPVMAAFCGAALGRYLFLAGVAWPGALTRWWAPVGAVGSLGALGALLPAPALQLVAVAAAAVLGYAWLVLRADIGALVSDPMWSLALMVVPYFAAAGSGDWRVEVAAMCASFSGFAVLVSRMAARRARSFVLATAALLALELFLRWKP